MTSSILAEKVDFAVDQSDDIAKQVTAAQKRAEQVYSPEVKTLVDEISDEQWQSWDASEEYAILMDSDLDEEDLNDSDCHDLK
ncbi:MULTISPECIES: hypothetical protein [Thalassospira]|jgi:hypothetical protein|uniref:hypothetical protein n=1 Tax=Thalassospira TaxID=168934 RepID=UPI0007A609E6|nr:MULTISPECIES: hypothetical protein [Thalassospira]MAL28134.1 hypothetical protein [Thalassospira sp.]MBR9781587.1 hypothetical protein [Rhodospirillales bacterium]KZD09159.1 hypothetical protein AUP45_14245 [Thalassospira xiamenensis]MBL4839308.1 hypothetical protein [Thalassospira sp.]MBR9816312.1 hypothetical protein [Rhodospirillales bacterium]|tara:strand:+ start:818 stop:1066 length:249 start_codon:yes stop_codon:yes gene_type:complete